MTAPEWLTDDDYILHTRAALAASPLVQEIVAEAVKAATGNVVCNEGHSCPHGPQSVYARW